MVWLQGVLLMAAVIGQGAVVLDRIAILVNNRIIKDSDIDRDLRVTDLLNGVALNVSPAARKEAATRLIDQMLIRREMEVAQYPEGSPEEAQKLLEELRKQRFNTDAAFKAALERYGVTEAQLRRQLEWQTTVLNFIDQRFRPGVMVTDDDVQKYFNQHAADLRRQSGGRPVTLESTRDSIERQLTGERVNQQFFGWLEDARKQATIRYLEPELK